MVFKAWPHKPLYFTVVLKAWASLGLSGALWCSLGLSGHLWGSLGLSGVLSSLTLLLLGADWKADSVAICCASALFAAFGPRPKADSVAIYGASALFAPFGRRLESKFCSYLLCFRSLCCFWVQAGKQILSLITVLLLSLLLLDADWKADSVAICGASALFAAFGCRLESRFCRYLLCFRSLCCFWAPAGKQIL